MIDETARRHASRRGGDVPRFLTDADVEDLLDYPSLVEALANAFRDGYQAPARHQHAVNVPGGGDATLLLMPAWVPGRFIGTKVAHVFPDNGKRGLPSVQSTYLLSSGATGKLLAVLGGNTLTTRRTVAASSLALRYLARADASRLLIVGTGQIARDLATSHATQRPIREVDIWGRDPRRASELAASLRQAGFVAKAVTDLATSAGEADIVSCCTLSTRPLVRGIWLKAGTHLDLIGSFTPAMREVDDDAVARAAVYVDTEAAVSKSGDLCIPLQNGTFSRDRLAGDLAGLVSDRQPGRIDERTITLFKSVGAAIEDLAAAVLAFERALMPAR